MDMTTAISILKSFGYTEEATMLQAMNLDKNAQNSLLIGQVSNYECKYLPFIVAKTFSTNKNVFRNFLQLIQKFSTAHKDKSVKYSAVLQKNLNKFDGAYFQNIIEFFIENDDLINECTVQTFDFIVNYDVSSLSLLKDTNINSFKAFIVALNNFSNIHNINDETLSRIFYLLNKKFICNSTEKRYELVADILNNPIHPNLNWVAIGSDGLDYFYPFLYSKDFQKWNGVLKIQEMSVKQIRQWFKLIKNFDIKVTNVAECVFWGYIAKNHQWLQNISEQAELHKVQAKLYVLWEVFVVDKEITLENNQFDVFCKQTENYQINNLKY